jgi:small subunit ribosomal protein S2
VVTEITSDLEDAITNNPGRYFYTMMDLKQLIAVGAHFGHQTSRWCPKMSRYIWGHKNNVHLIDVSKTAQELERAAKFLENAVVQGKTILFVGTKKAAQEAIKSVAERVNMPFVTHRWVGGTLSNFTQVKKSVTKLLHFEDVIGKATKFPHYTKKELNTFGKLVERLKKSVGGIRHLSWPLGAVVVVDVLKEKSAIKEATAMGIPVVAIVDTNGDPTNINYVIPANDDAPRVVKLLVDYLGDAVHAGKEKVAQAKAEKVEKAEVGQQARQETVRQDVAPAVEKADVEASSAEPKKVKKPMTRVSTENRAPKKD